MPGTQRAECNQHSHTAINNYKDNCCSCYRSLPWDVSRYRWQAGESLSLVQHGERLGEPTLSQDRAFYCFTSQGQDFCPRNLFLAAITDLVHSVTQRRHRFHPARWLGALPCKQMLTDCIHISVLALHIKVQPASHRDTHKTTHTHPTQLKCTLAQTSAKQHTRLYMCTHTPEPDILDSMKRVRVCHLCCVLGEDCDLWSRDAVQL